MNRSFSKVRFPSIANLLPVTSILEGKGDHFVNTTNAEAAHHCLPKKDTDLFPLKPLETVHSLQYHRLQSLQYHWCCSNWSPHCLPDWEWCCCQWYWLWLLRPWCRGCSGVPGGQCGIMAPPTPVSVSVERTPPPTLSPLLASPEVLRQIQQIMLCICS